MQHSFWNTRFASIIPFLMKNLLKLIVAMTLVGAGLLRYSYFQKHYYIGLGGIQKYDRVQIYIQARH